MKIDTAIEKLSEVNTTVSRILAVHEERISKQEETDAILFAKIDKLSDKMDVNYDNLHSRVRGLEKRVWMTIGSLFVASFVANHPGLVSNLLTVEAQPPRIERSNNN